ncbi:hypothetical protein HRbin27_01442 [bacterium HR27]|nr:hypothetical protein HRbin27_01442 [bacterium HR27]
MTLLALNARLGLLPEPLRRLRYGCPDVLLHWRVAAVSRRSRTETA